jgi:hypothetical protein
MVASGAVVPTLISILIGANLNIKFKSLTGVLNDPAIAFISDDMNYGIPPSTGDTNLDFIYYDLRYKIFYQATVDYLNQLKIRTEPTDSGIVSMYVSSTGVKSICSSLLVPKIIQKVSTNVSG